MYQKRGVAGQKIGDIMYPWGGVLVCQKSGYFYEPEKSNGVLSIFQVP